MGPPIPFAAAVRRGDGRLAFAPFPIEGAGVLRARTSTLSEMRRDVCRGGLAQGCATLTLTQEPKSKDALSVSRPWP